MSVWFTESFRGQIFWDVAKLRGLTQNEWRNFVEKTDVTFAGGTLAASGPFEEVNYPKGPAAELIKKTNQHNAMFEQIFYTNPRNQVTRGKNGHVLKTLLPRVDKFTTGLSAVYGLFSDFNELPKSYAATEASRTGAFVGQFIEHAFRAQVGVMKTTPEAALEAFSRLDTRAVQEANRWQVIASRVRNLLTARWKSSIANESKGIFPHDRSGKTKMTNWSDHQMLDLPDTWSVYFDGWSTFIQTDRHADREMYALSSVDLDRVQQMCISFSMLELHQATWALTAGNSQVNYKVSKRNLVNFLLDAIKRCSDPENELDPNVLCRDLRKAFNTYLSMSAGRLSDDGTSDMIQEAKKKKYNTIFDPNKYIRLLASTPFDIAQDLGRLYKLLPAPDYDIGQSFVARQKQHLAMNPLNEIMGDNPCTIAEFKQYMRKLMILTLVLNNKRKGVGAYIGDRKPPWWADYERSGILPDRLSVVDEIDLRATASYVERTPEGVAAWKDSAACEEKLEDVQEEVPASSKRRNMLLRFLFDPSCPDAVKARSMLNRTEHVHRVGFKMEAHKTEARLFFIGNMSDRLVQSEMEENVHRIALNCPGYMIGQTPEFTTRKIMSMVAPRLDPDEKVHFLNFDISAWSPGMRDDIQRISHELWGEVFDRPEFMMAHKINEQAIVVLNKRGYHGEYINPGANFEGYNGKEMTFLHCALMGYSVYRYRRKHKHSITVSLCAYIDDGLASFKDKKTNGARRFLDFADVVEDTYQRLGFLLEKSKCFLSDKFAIFLNEIYYMGRHITYGLRAIMRVGTKTFEPHETLSARANSYFSGAQGAMRAGLDVLAGFITFLWLISRLLLIYGANKFLDARASVLYALTPRALGGLGCPSYASLVTNLVTDTLVEGISCMQELVRAYPQYGSKVITLLKQPIKARSPTSMLVSPSTVTDTLAPMMENRLKNAVAIAIRKASLAPKAKEFLNVSKSSDLQSFAESVMTVTAHVVPSVFADLVDSTPFALFVSLLRKFESSRTMVILVGKKKMTDIARENKRDAFASLKAFVMR